LGSGSGAPLPVNGFPPLSAQINPSAQCKFSIYAQRGAASIFSGAQEICLRSIRSRKRVIAAVVLLLLAKFATVGVPLVLKRIVDVVGEPEALAALPVLLLAGYAFLRFTVTLFAELRDAVFARATQQTISGFALKVFGHLHSLPPRFHLSRQTGALSRDIERGTRGVGFVLSIALFNVVPTLVEITLVLGILLASYDIWFSLIILGTFVL
jgi:ATP-binding cassette subfamily B protein